MFNLFDKVKIIHSSLKDDKIHKITSFFDLFDDYRLYILDYNSKFMYSDLDLILSPLTNIDIF